MAIDDKLEKTLANLASSTEADVGREIIKIAIKTIPVVGSGIDKLMSGLAQRRLVERILDVFNEIKSQVEGLEKDQIRKEYFTSEEFQTLLALALQEIQTTHDQKKLKMLAAALCNSGKVQFQAETRKELFVRVLRSLSPEHIEILYSLSPLTISDVELVRLRSSSMRWASPELVTEDGVDVYRKLKRSTLGKESIKAYRTIRGPKGEKLLLLQNLASHGLLEETITRPSETGYRKAPPLSEIDEEYLVEAQTKATLEEMRRIGRLPKAPEPQALPVRCFRMSKFGEQFIAFVTKKDDTTTPS